MGKRREFFGKWKYSKKRGAWIWKWKRRKVAKSRALSLDVGTLQRDGERRQEK